MIWSSEFAVFIISHLDAFVELFMKRCFYVGFRRCAFEPGDLITIHQSIHSDEAEQKSVVHPHKAIYLGAFNGEELIVHGVYRQTNSDCQLIGENSIPKGGFVCRRCTLSRLFDIGFRGDTPIERFSLRWRVQFAGEGFRTNKRYSKILRSRPDAVGGYSFTLHATAPFLQL